MSSLKTLQENVNSWCYFAGDEQRGYVLIAIARKAHNDDLTNAGEIVHRRIVTGRQDVQSTTREVHTLAEADKKHTYRYYLTVNARDLEQAFGNFLQEQTKWLTDAVRGDDPSRGKMRNVAGEWKSEVHRPRNKCDSYFQFDLDSDRQTDLDTLASSLGGETTVRNIVETPNGWHILTEPFEYPAWEPPVKYDDLDTDGQLYVGRSMADD